MILCPLCDNQVEKLHPRSHTIPDWIYRDVSDVRNKAAMVGIDQGTLKKAQTGSHGTIICESCEQITQKYDRYASLALTKRSPESPEHKNIKFDTKSGVRNGNHMTASYCTGFDFGNLQKFLFACTLRHHLLRKKEGQYLLTAERFTEMKELFWDETHDDEYFPIVVYKIEAGDGFDSIVFYPFKSRRNGCRIIEFYAAGFIFFIYVSSHYPPQSMMNMRLKKDGSLYMYHTKMSDTGTFKNSIPIIQKIGTENERSSGRKFEI